MHLAVSHRSVDTARPPLPELEAGEFESTGDSRLFCQGDTRLLTRPTYCVLNSRQPRRPSASAPWLRWTFALAERFCDRRVPLVTSVGLLPYEAAAYGARLAGRPRIVVLPGPLPAMLPRQARSAWYDTYLDVVGEDRVLLVSCHEGRTEDSNERDAWQKRDGLVRELSSVLVAVSVRRGGNMEAHVRDALSAGKSVWTVCGIGDLSASVRSGRRRAIQTIPRSWLAQKPLPWESCGSSAGPSAHFENALPRQDADCDATVESLREGEYLFHYTRSCPGPWPGQSRAEYLEELRGGAVTAAHSGADALLRIATERTIYASGRLIRGRRPVVCFTELGPERIARQARWVRGQRRWNFEPYAIAIERRYARRKGIRPVLHLSEDEYGRLPEQQRYLFQRCDPPDCDWRAEKEWRLSGSFDFRDAPEDSVALLVATVREQRRMARLVPFDVYAIGDAWTT